MAAERLSMRKIIEVLRLAAAGHSNRAIARSVGISHSTVGEYRTRARAAGVSWPLSSEWTPSELEARLFPPPAPSNVARPLPDWAKVYEEMKRRSQTSVTLQLLWVEYKEDHPGGLQYSQFCELYRRWKGSLDLVLRHEHRAGEKAFVDYAGQTVPVVERATGEIREAQVFVGVLGASSFTYAEATWTQSLPDWTGAHVRMFDYFGGVPELVVPDNLGSGVSRACRYEPDVNPTYQELATHYGTAVLPARGRQAEGQGKGRDGRSGRRALDPGPAPQADVLRPGGAEPGDPPAPRAAERAAVPEAAGLAPLAVRAAGPAGARAASGAAVRAVDLEEGPGQHRLPHRGRGPLLQRAPCPRAPAGRCPPDRAHGRGPAR
jgi:transposase